MSAERERAVATVAGGGTGVARRAEDASGVPSAVALPAAADVVPHTGTSVLLERLLSVDQTHVHAAVRITPTPYSLPDGGLPGWCGLEIMAQAVSAYAGCKALKKGDPIRPGLLLGTRAYQCATPTLPAGATYDVYVVVSTMDDDGLGVFDCELRDGGATVASASLTVFQPEDATRFLQEQAAAESVR
jgi:predicted hotdog family 3-hydroxylacyl-ACP dehydratase